MSKDKWIYQEGLLYEKPSNECVFDSERKAKQYAKKRFFELLQEQASKFLTTLLKTRSYWGKSESIVLEKPTNEFTLRVGDYVIHVKKAENKPRPERK